MGQKRDITIKIFDHPIKISINADEEEKYRVAEKSVNANLLEYANVYSQFDREVILCLVAYEETLLRGDLEAELSGLEAKLDKVISEEI